MKIKTAIKKLKDLYGPDFAGIIFQSDGTVGLVKVVDCMGGARMEIMEAQEYDSGSPTYKILTSIET